MTIPVNTAAMLRSPSTAPGHHGHELPDPAHNDLQNEDQWVDDFIERLHGAIEDLRSKK